MSDVVLARYPMLRELEIPVSLMRALTSIPAEGLEDLVYRARPPDDRPPALSWALALLRTAVQPAPRNLVPLMPVDDRSLACVVCGPAEDSGLPIGTVIRWHLDDIPLRAQGQILDVGVDDYLDMRSREMAARDTGFQRMDKIAELYHKDYGEKGISARSYIKRPIRLAVQNVIVGLAAWEYDQKFNALYVSAWQVCETPHLAAHEATRGLLALTLGEAFRCGSTMEIRFHGHPEGGVPAAVRQFARIHGISLQQPKSILPIESRKLLWQVCGLDPSLRESLQRIAEAGLLTPERACYSMLAGVWAAAGLDYLIRTAPLVAERVLRGGSSPLDWQAHRIELRLARRAFLVERLVVATGRSADDDTFEDSPHQLRWHVNGNSEGIVVSDVSTKPAWVGAEHLREDALILPRDMLDPADMVDGALFLIPLDGVMPEAMNGQVIRAPWTLTEIDREVGVRMHALATARA